MKKAFFLFLFFLFSNFIFSQENAIKYLPEELIGLWEGKDRLIFFEERENFQNPELFVVLKDFYGWYYDRAAESDEYSKKAKKLRNDATPKKAEEIPYSVTKDDNYNVFYFKINYSKHENYEIPMVLINDNFFLNFCTRDLNFNDLEQLEKAKQNYEGFYRGNIVTKGIMISNQFIPENIFCFYIIEDRIYNIRYWKTDMDYSSEYANFSYEQDSFDIPKHIQSGGQLYSCVTGRSKKVRNPQAPEKFNPNDYIFNDEKSVLVLDKNIYLTKMADKKTFEDLIEIVNTANSKKHPVKTQIFPDSNLDFHWDLIDVLEKDNKLIQEVRNRQNLFGLRAKDLIKNK